MAGSGQLPSTDPKGSPCHPLTAGCWPASTPSSSSPADRHGLALLPGGRLAAAEARVAARAAGIGSAKSPAARGSPFEGLLVRAVSGLGSTKP